MKKTITTALAALMATATFAAGEINHAQIDEDGNMTRPADPDWREWVYIGAPLTPHFLNGGEARFPEFHNVYVENSAWDHFKATGELPEGTQIAKELVLLYYTEDECDAETQECYVASGGGYFQGEFAGLEIAYKNTERFPDEPGGWVYYAFGHQPEPYEATAVVEPNYDCNACHYEQADFDFTFSQFYPVMRAILNEKGIEQVPAAVLDERANVAAN